MPAPVIVLPSSVISKIRRGRREGGSMVRTRQRCTPPHAHAAILQAVLASLKMAAGAQAAPAGSPLPAPGSQHPAAGRLAAVPRGRGERGQWERGSRHGGLERALEAWRAAILARVLLTAPRHWVCSAPQRSHQPSRLGKITIHLSFARHHTLVVAFPLDVSSTGAKAGLAPHRRPLSGPGCRPECGQ